MQMLGAGDKYLRLLEKQFSLVEITARDTHIRLHGPEKQVSRLFDILSQMFKVAVNNEVVTDNDFETILSLSQALNEDPKDWSDFSSGVIVMTNSGKPIRAKTPGQREIVKCVSENDIVFAIGPAGTGKTFTSVALAVKALKEKKVKKIVLVRPAVEAGENLGFLPGGLKEKIDPYLRPLYDALEEMLDFDRLRDQMERHVIEIAPLAYMRGRTLNNAFVILDEAQNATQSQMKMFLTRLGEESKAIITGDITQTDLPRNKTSGLVSVQTVLAGIKGIAFTYLGRRDVVRHKLIREIIKAYESFDKENEEVESDVSS